MPHGYRTVRLAVAPETGMNRIDGLTVVEPTDTFVRPRAAAQQNRMAKTAVLLAYAAGGWAALVAAVYLIFELL